MKPIKKALTVKGGCFLFCILIEYSLILFILWKVVFLSQYAAVFLSFVLSSGRSKESVLYVRFSSWYHSAFSPESQEHDSVKSQKFLASYKIFYACDFFYVMSTNPHQTRSQNLLEHNLPLF